MATLLAVILCVSAAAANTPKIRDAGGGVARTARSPVRSPEPARPVPASLRNTRCVLAGFSLTVVCAHQLSLHAARVRLLKCVRREQLAAEVWSLLWRPFLAMLSQRTGMGAVHFGRYNSLSDVPNVESCEKRGAGQQRRVGLALTAL